MTVFAWAMFGWFVLQAIMSLLILGKADRAMVGSERLIRCTILMIETCAAAWALALLL